MRKFLSLFLAGCLIFLLPATIWASAETTYESEQGQAMIKAPSSSVFGSGDSTDSADDADSSDSDSSEGDEDTVSSGIDWSAANTASAPLPITQALPYVSIRDIRAAGST